MDGYGFQPPRNTDEASQRIAEHLGGTLLTRASDLPLPVDYDHTKPDLRHRIGYGVDVTEFYKSCALTADGFPKVVTRGVSDIENLLVFDDLIEATGTTHKDRLSQLLREEDIREFDWKQADPYDPSWMLKQVAEDLGLRVVPESEEVVPLGQAWKELLVNTGKRFTTAARVHVAKPIIKEAVKARVVNLLKRADSTSPPGGDIKL